MKRISMTLALIASTISLGAIAAGSPVCAQINNKTGQVITLNVGNGNYVTKIANIGEGLNHTVFRATPTFPKIQFAANPNRPGNINGTFVATPGAVQLTKNGNITIQSANGTKSACNVFWTISVFKG